MAKAIGVHRKGGQLVVTGRLVTWRGPLLLLACVGVALLGSACQTVATRPNEPVATRPDEPLDPQALVGEWRGEYVNHFNPSFSDVLVVTITRVEGDRVFGTLDQWVPGKGGARNATPYENRSRDAARPYPQDRHLRGHG